MAITWATVTAIAPELATAAADTQASILAYVNDEAIHDATWRDAAKANRARQYLAAHMGTLSRAATGARGPVQSETAGPVSRTYAVASAAGSEDLDSTGYGKVYARLTHASFGGPWVP